MLLTKKYDVMCKKMVATKQIKSLVPRFLVNWCLFIHKNTNTVDYYTNFLSIMKPSLPVKKKLAQRINESKKKLSTVWKPTLTCYEEKIHSDCLTTILYYQKPLMQQCKQIQLYYIFVYIKNMM